MSNTEHCAGKEKNDKMSRPSFLFPIMLVFHSEQTHFGNVFHIRFVREEYRNDDEVVCSYETNNVESGETEITRTF